jgi:ATP-dependent RNA helicase DDX52/ROK1
VLGCAPTGSGKTAAFILPILVSLHVPKKEGFRAVVVSPTRELATQTYREFKRFSKGKQWNLCLLTKATAASNAFGENSWKKFGIYSFIHSFCCFMNSLS